MVKNIEKWAFFAQKCQSPTVPSRVLAIASSRSRTFLQRLFRRDAETKTRGPSRIGVARGTRNTAATLCLILGSAGSLRTLRKACVPCFLFRTSQLFH